MTKWIKVVLITAALALAGTAVAPSLGAPSVAGHYMGGGGGHRA